jgi:protein kinase
MEKYKIIKKLGEGAFGVVVKAVNTNTNQLVAIKKMKGDMADWQKCIEMPEVKALQKLNSSQFIVKILEMVHNKKEQEVNIVFEYCEKNLYSDFKDRAQKNKRYNESEIKNLMYQAIAGIAYVHQNGYMHRDIKPENFLINPENQQLKVADFGLAKEVRRGQNNNTEYVSTRWYRAPELALRSKNYNQSVDVFALGCVMAEMFLNRPLFPGTTETDQITRIITVLGTPSQMEWPDGWKLAGSRSLKLREEKAVPLSTHFVSCSNMSADSLDLLGQMLRIEPDKRISASECLQHQFFSDVPMSLKSLHNQAARVGGRIRVHLNRPNSKMNIDTDQANESALKAQDLSKLDPYSDFDK